MKYQYYVYVFELNEDPKYVYVGQSYLEPKERRLQHINGPHKSPAIRHCKIGKLRPDLYGRFNPISSRDKALEIEEQLAEELRSKGYNVEGGH